MKGAGFFVGGFLLDGCLRCARRRRYPLAGGVLIVLIGVLAVLPPSIGQAKKKPAFAGILSNSPGINRLSAARLVLFAARDVWFVVSVPIFLSSILEWSFTQVGGFMALWVIAYGGVQSVAPVLLRNATGSRVPGPGMACALDFALAGVTALIVSRGELHEQIVRMLPVVDGGALADLTSRQQVGIPAATDRPRFEAHHASQTDMTAATERSAMPMSQLTMPS